MKGLTRFALWLYPSAWRRRYRAELEALIEDSGPGWGVIADLMKESIRMQLTTWSFGKLAVLLSLAGVIAGAVGSAFMPKEYASVAKLEISQSPHAPEHLRQMENQILSRLSLRSIILDPRLDLYASERESLPLEDVIEKMRADDIRIRIDSSSIFSISFRYPDKVKAQKTVQALIVKFQDENLKAFRIVGADRDHLIILDQPHVVPRNWWDGRVFKAQVDMQMVPGAVSEDRSQLIERLKRIENDVMSRNSLSSIIQDPRLDLYAEERKSKSLEDVIDKMKQNIRIDTKAGEPLALTISFRYPNSRLAARGSSPYSF